MSVLGYNIASSEVAAAVALQARKALEDLKPASDAGKIHLFANAPAALAVLVGRWLNAVGQVQLYEFRGEYVPSIARTV